MRVPASGSLIAIAGLAVAGSVFAVSLHRALTLDAVAPDVPAPAQEPPASGDPPMPVPLRSPSEATLSRAEIAYAVEHDPFQPDRERPEPFRLPGEFGPQATPAERPPPPEFRMTGIVGSGDGGLALIETDGMTPQVLSVGESVLGYRLESVRATSATLAGHGETLELQLVQANPRPGADGSSARPFRLSTINVGGRNMSTEIANILRAAQQSGMNATQLQALRNALMRQLETTVEIAPRVVIRRNIPDAPSRVPDNR